MKRRHIYILIFVATAIYSAWFGYHVLRQKTEQFSYDWNKTQYPPVLQDTLWAQPVYLNYNRVDFLTDATPEFSPDWIYAFNNKKGIFYFRANYIRKKGDTVSFRYIHWLNNVYPRKKTGGKLYARQIPLKQSGNIEVVTFGDTYLIYKQANFFRKMIKKAFANFFFSGRHTDIFGYPHEALLLANVDTLLQSAKQAPQADYYIVFFGMHDDHTPQSEWEKKTKRILEILEQKVRKKIFLLLLPEFNENQKRHNRFFKKIKQKKIEIISTEKIINYPRNFDTIAKIPDRKGYRLLARYLANQIKTGEKNE